jgi:hypothetical protein
LRDLKEAISLAPQDADVSDAMRNLQLSLSGTTEDPIDLLHKFLRGDSGAGTTILSSIGSEPFARKLAEDGLEHIPENGVQVDNKTTGSILLKLSNNQSKDVLAGMIKNDPPFQLPLPS